MAVASGRNTPSLRPVKYSFREPRGAWGDRLIPPDSTYSFIFYALRWQKPTLLLNSWVTSFSWTDSGSAPFLTADISLRSPDPSEPPPPLEAGDRVSVLVRENYGPPVRMWTLRVIQPQGSANDGTWTFQLQSDIAALMRSTDIFGFTYANAKAKGKGWLASEVAIYIAKRYQFPIAEIVETKHYIRRLVYASPVSPLDCIIEAYKRERRYTGRRFVVWWDDRGLHINPIRRSGFLLALGPTIIEASLTTGLHERFATAVTVRGFGGAITNDTHGHGKGKNHKTLGQALTTRATTGSTGIGQQGP